MTATMQTYARKNLVAIDTLEFKTNVMPIYSHSQVNEKPETGVYLHGLFMQGAKWDEKKKCVDDSLAGVSICDFPIIWLEPILGEDLKMDKQF
jgi:dynein heavy chain